MGKELYHTKLAVPLTREQKERLKKQSEKHSITMNQLIREGIEMALKKYERKN